jgi:hypothetical protein
MRYNRLEYLVKWKGYDGSHNQWEEHTQLHAKSKIVQFHHKHPGAARHINAAIFDSIPFTRADCKGITQTLIPDTLAVKPKASQSTDGNLLWSVVYISDTACLRAGAADDTQPALADPHPLRRPWPVTGGYAAGVP